MVRLITALILSILFLIFILQNSQPVKLNFLIWEFNGSLALILILTFVVAIIISLLVSIPLYIGRMLKKNKSEKTVVAKTEDNPKNP